MNSSFYSDIAYSYAVNVTPHDTNENLRGAKFVMNDGTAGDAVIRQNVSPDKAGVAPTAAATVTIALPVGQMIPCGASWMGVNSTGLTAGVTLIAFF